jgi:hypothetical protein
MELCHNDATTRKYYSSTYFQSNENKCIFIFYLAGLVCTISAYSVLSSSRRMVGISPALRPVPRSSSAYTTSLPFFSSELGATFTSSSGVVACNVLCQSLRQVYVFIPTYYCVPHYPGLLIPVLRDKCMIFSQTIAARPVGCNSIKFESRLA